VGGPGAGGQGADFGDLGNFGDLFNDLFGDIFGGGGGRGGSRRGRGQRGADLRYNLEISLDDVVNGCEPRLKIPRMNRCGTCSGSGAAEGSKPSRCGRCEGTGQLVFQQGFFRVNRPCDACGGAGEVISNPCSTCRGAGRVEGQQTIQVKVPPGIDDGARMRVTGEGEAGVAGGPPGDLYVVMVLREHSLFRREGTDLHLEVPIAFVQAVLGGEIEVPTLDGKVKLSIPEGTQSGRVLRLRGKGLPPLQPRLDPAQLKKLRGDLYVKVFVEVPTRLNARQRELLEEFAAQSGHEVSPATKGFVEKLRDLFD
jgi:molecular chaperone DnaJ